MTIAHFSGLGGLLTLPDDAALVLGLPLSTVGHEGRCLRMFLGAWDVRDHASHGARVDVPYAAATGSKSLEGGGKSNGRVAKTSRLALSDDTAGSRPRVMDKSWTGSTPGEAGLEGERGVGGDAGSFEARRMLPTPPRPEDCCKSG